MAKIHDTGKVWIRGRIKPEYAVRVGERFFVPGKEDSDDIHCWVEGEFLCVDLHDKNGERRVARKISLNAPANAPGALFSGFEKTKHADVLVVTANVDGVEEFVVEGADYRNERVKDINSLKFWEKVWRRKNLKSP